MALEMSTRICYSAHSLSIILFCVTLMQVEIFASSTNALQERDLLALQAFRSMITHDPEGILNSWNDSRHFCEWEGIKCSRRHRRVTVLDLNSRGLIGSLSPHIGSLSFLTEMDLSRNTIKGEIPHEFGRLFRLESLDLSNNSLVGEIPANLSYCSRLTRILLGRNKLVGNIPTEFVSLNNLKILAIHWNNLTGGIPPFLGNITSLEIISLASNAFTGNIPDSLGQLKQLTSLGLAANNLSGTVPPSIYNLSFLANFSLARNQLHGSLPPNFGLTLPNLQLIQIGENFFGGSIPVSLSNASKLRVIEMYDNSFSGKLSVDFRSIEHLSKLNVGANNLGTGEDDEMSFMNSLVNCSNLHTLAIDVNLFRGALPHSIVNLSSQLQHLIIGLNHIYGSIPSGISNIVNLEFLDMHNNHITGTIPNEMGKFQNLRWLVLAGNNFSGEIPSSVGNLTALDKLFLGNNKLSGAIPSSLGKLERLTVLELSENELGGTIPEEIFNITFLSTGLYLEQNQLVGSIPPNIGNLRDRRAKQKLHSGSTLENVLLRVSYESLVKATDGFSSTNLLGVGSFSSVYKGNLDQDGTVAAIKVLNLQRRGSLKSFMAECKALRNIRHRNLVKIITSCSSIDFEGNDFKALVYEYMPNGSLEKWLHPALEIENEEVEVQNLSLLQRISIAIDAASAIEYLHHHCEEPVLHCDLKPSNVLLDGDMIAHVGDFGLVRFQPEISNPDQSSSVGVRGTIGYTAPEYGLGSEVSTNGDVYSYGILLLEMVTRKKPTEVMFEGDLNLHNFARTALPDRIIDIVDRVLLNDDEEVATTNCRPRQPRNYNRMECLLSLVRIGVACSMESPQDRMNITDVVPKLQSARKILLEQEEFNP
ncbi:putative Receptor-kinase [Melia azedarach]|uniref:Receptor-kinase n=1 Tax=Melia azedarach TaxID=155640 RepID=A0ACC1Y9T7_MELAZ|nr:putative Receptor-kinase [Melia azedarach]